MSWYDPLSDWDVQYILTRREACARRFLYLAEAVLSVPDTMVRGAERSCVREQGSCSGWGSFWQDSLSQPPQGLEGCGFQTPRALCCIQPCPAHGTEPLGWFGKAGCCSLVCYAELWAQPVSSTWGHRPHVTLERTRWARGGSRAEAALPSSSHLQEEVGYQLLSKKASGKLWPIENYVRHVWSLKTTVSWQYQHWKQMLNWLEIILAESHSRSPGTNKLMQNAFQSLRSVWFWENSELLSLWHCCRALHRPCTNGSSWKQWSTGRECSQMLLVHTSTHMQHLSEALWLTALERHKCYQFQLLLLQAELIVTSP